MDAATGGYDAGGYGSKATAGPRATPGAPAAGNGATVEVATIAGTGPVLVAGSNGMTVYTFAQDVANSGTSACTGDCLARWPSVTIPAGSKPVPGDGVTGTLGTITRADDGALQVTYDGLPLYFFAGDSSPGDTRGSYPGWNLVKP